MEIFSTIVLVIVVLLAIYLFSGSVSKEETVVPPKEELVYVVMVESYENMHFWEYEPATNQMGKFIKSNLKDVPKEEAASCIESIRAMYKGKHVLFLFEEGLE